MPLPRVIRYFHRVVGENYRTWRSIPLKMDAENSSEKPVTNYQIIQRHIAKTTLLTWGTRWCSWLRHWATSRKVAGSIPESVDGIFHWHNPSGRTMALRSTQPLTEMITRNIFLRSRDGRCVALTTLPPSCTDCLEIWEPQPPGTLRACPGL